MGGLGMTPMGSTVVSSAGVSLYYRLTLSVFTTGTLSRLTSVLSKKSTVILQYHGNFGRFAKARCKFECTITILLCLVVVHFHQFPTGGGMRVSLANGVHWSSFDTGGLSSALATSLKYKVVDFSWSGTKSSDWVLSAKICSLSPCSVVAPGIHFGAPLSFPFCCVTDGGTCNTPPISPNFISTSELLWRP